METLIKPEDILYAYQSGYFPMADSFDNEIYWHNPDPRAIFPFNKIKPPRSLKQTLKKRNFLFKVNSDFEQVIRRCADREETWISEEIIQLYCILNRMGYSHSVETWENGEMVAGLYGVSINSAFFGESMFTSVTDGSKAAFYHFVELLKKKDFILLDSQYINRHTRNLGAVEISRERYMNILEMALAKPNHFSFIDLE